MQLIQLTNTYQKHCPEIKSKDNNMYAVFHGLHVMWDKIILKSNFQEHRIQILIFFT